MTQNHLSIKVFGELFGAGVFVTTVVAGSVAITKPFKVNHIKHDVIIISLTMFLTKKHEIKKWKKAKSDNLTISTFSLTLIKR